MSCMCVFVWAHACMWLEDSVALVHMLDSPLNLQALLLLLCFHGDIVTYCCTEDSASVPVFVRRN